MSLWNPAALLWLLLAVPAILLLYLLKMKRRDRVVSSVMLWSRLVRDMQANTPFQKLRRSPLLLLQILLVALLAVGLGRPFVRARALGGRNVVLVVDGSASMRATDVPGGRFEEARRLARRVVNDMGRGDAALVVLAGARAQPLCPLTTDRAALSRAVESMRPTDAPANLREALLLASSLMAGRRDAEILLLSDGAFESLEPLAGATGAGDDTAPLPARVRFLKIGRRGDNVGITALDTRRSPGGTQGQQVFVQVRNFSEGEKRATLELRHEDALLDAREVRLAPGQARGEVFRLRADAKGLLRARLDVRDDLEADNSAALMLQPQRQVRILLFSRGNVFLEKALNVDPRVSLVRAEPEAAASALSKGYDIVVVDGKAPANLPARGRTLYLAAGGPTAPVTITGEVAHPSFLDWERHHPVTRFLDLGNVQIARALQARPQPWAQVLAHGENAPLIVAGEREGLRSLFLAFSLTQSDLPMRVAFPILIANALDWLMGEDEATAAARTRTGEVLSADLPPEVRQVQVTLPDGTRRVHAVERSPFLFGDTAQAGIYRLEGRGKGEAYQARLAVSLLNAGESDTRPRERIRIGSTALPATDPAAQQVRREVWRWAALLALALLVLEWHVYHRRP